MDFALFSGFSTSVSHIMYIFSNALLYPVLISLIFLVILTLVFTGEFITEYTKRRRDLKEITDICEQIREASSVGSYDKCANILKNLKKQTQVLTSFSNTVADYVPKKDIQAIERTADDYDEKMMKRLEKTRIITTVGPMLGLMGTLIPLGPALIGLTTGNIETLATNLVVAFATTVIGLFSASVAYCLTTIRQRWYWQDSTDMDYIIDALGMED